MLLYHFFLRGRVGKKYESAYDRAVEETSDESTKIKSLSDQHALVLKKHDDDLAALRGQHDTELASLRGSHAGELDLHKSEAVRLQGLVGGLDTTKQEVVSLQANISKLNEAHALQGIDWKRRLVEADSTASTNTKRVAKLEAAAAKADADWKARLSESDAAAAAARSQHQSSLAAHASELAALSARAPRRRPTMRRYKRWLVRRRRMVIVLPASCVRARTVWSGSGRRRRSWPPAMRVLVMSGSRSTTCSLLTIRLAMAVCASCGHNTTPQ